MPTGKPKASPKKRCSPISGNSALPGALVADANVILSATIRGRASIVFAHPDAPVIFAAVAVKDEVEEWLPRLALKRRADLGLLLMALENLPIRWAEPAVYGHYEKEARRRMADRDEDDWPTVALALALERSFDLAVWSQDKDFEVSQLRLMTTGALLDLLREHD